MAKNKRPRMMKTHKFRVEADAFALSAQPFKALQTTLAELLNDPRKLQDIGALNGRRSHPLLTLK